MSRRARFRARVNPLQTLHESGIQRFAARYAAALALLPAFLLVFGTTGCSKGSGASVSSDSTAAQLATGTSAKAGPGAPKGDQKPDTNRVNLSVAAYATAGITIDTVRRTSVTASSGGLEVPAQIEFDPARVALISPRTTGRIERLTAVVGDRVSAGQIVGYLSSPDFLTAEADFLQAKRRATLLAGTADAEGTAALARAARQRLELLGVPPTTITRLESGAEPAALLPIVAPFGGSIVQSMALAGAAVQPGTPIFQIADISVVNAVAQVPERSLAVVHEGQAGSVSVTAFPALLFVGHVTRIQSELDSATRTIKALVRVPNPSRRLRPGMFATVRLRVASGAASGAASLSSNANSPTESLITIPESAVIVQGEERYVFVQVAPRTFERRVVTVVPLAPPGSVVGPGGRVIVQSGLAAGDLVVVAGAFTLQSELGKSQLGGDEG